jgi:Cu/Ag efflux pump CusA
MGFVAMLGTVALIGMIIRNSVLLVDQIETEKNAGRGGWNAVLEASQVRFRPIILTAQAMILGMAPIAPTVFWGPMAYAIMGGLAVATLLTLIALPSLYIIWFKIRKDSESSTPTYVPTQAPAQWQDQDAIKEYDLNHPLGEQNAMLIGDFAKS